MRELSSPVRWHSVIEDDDTGKLSYKQMRATTECAGELLCHSARYINLLHKMLVASQEVVIALEDHCMDKDPRIKDELNCYNKIVEICGEYFQRTQHMTAAIIGHEEI